ncbi:aldo/keto reductase [Geosporobacter ferrireducens]|uniref:Aldo/keto reductase n=1 Tax=Geosporobacter ferrireducens TaxID=1424294 RepID=A0A1D8GPR7_9FIRM|nr:aldo/keto reductase [Geosporobacter ferrireducens]AOT72858.1 aldo/keto reductase [Geosporobacter ferrireducens]MTI55262.1 aldo/keto reductase [Geosporobacter ferrireducens]
MSSLEYRILGNTGIKVSRLCFGALTIGPLQSNRTVDQGAEILQEAFRQGINFIDTAELYQTYPHIRQAIKNIDRQQLVIATKSYAYDRMTAAASLEKARKELDLDQIDIFLLHEQESEYTIRGHLEALKYFIKMKEAGILRAVGISTHHISGVRAAAKMDDIDIIHPIVNISGLGIQDGSMEEMATALEEAHQRGKGIYGMKPLGGGNLIHTADQCFQFVLNLSFLDAIAVGMQTIEEVKANAMRFKGLPIPMEIQKKINTKPRKLHIDDWCEKCGSCIPNCSHQALSIKNNILTVDSKVCVLCGYCSNYCPNFCIKIV